jgi:histone-lysine N-methyltransferase SETMAR
MKRAPRPPYSPDLAPSDFFLFGRMKRKLMGYRAESESELLVRIGVILVEVPRDVLNAVFLEWIDRLQKCIHINGDSVGCVKKA